MSTIETSASYEALDAQGRPYLRAPMWIHELPDPKTRCRALSEATTRIEDHLALVAFKDIGFGEPAYVAFGMSRPQAQAHQASKLLLTQLRDKPRPSVRGRIAWAGEEGLVPAEARHTSS